VAGTEDHRAAALRETALGAPAYVVAELLERRETLPAAGGNTEQRVVGIEGLTGRGGDRT
jgi:hypothetical protein